MTQKQELEKLKAIVAENVDRVSELEDKLDFNISRTKNLEAYVQSFKRPEIDQVSYLTILALALSFTSFIGMIVMLISIGG